jgi:hypothetical protein
MKRQDGDHQLDTIPPLSSTPGRVNAQSPTQPSELTCDAIAILHWTASLIRPKQRRPKQPQSQRQKQTRSRAASESQKDLRKSPALVITESNQPGWTLRRLQDDQQLSQKEACNLNIMI